MGTMYTKDSIAAMLDGLSVQAVAREAGVSAKTLYRIKDSRVAVAPNLATVEKIAAAVGRLRTGQGQKAKAAA